jgi:hypothetical protein
MCYKFGKRWKMNNEVLALVINGVSQTISQFIRYRPLHGSQQPTQNQPTEIIRLEANSPMPPTKSSFRKPTTDETVAQLEGRLTKILLGLQADLIDGARINGIPCDCILKHTSEMVMTTEELQTMSQKPIYENIKAWASEHQWGPEIVAEHPPEFFVGLVPELRALRKTLTETATVIQPAVQTMAPAAPPASPNILGMRELAKKVQSGEMTKEEAVGKIKTMMAISGKPST